MACIDISALAQYEEDARHGSAGALYTLGIAYSTGQGVPLDFIAAHKYFNLAAMKGNDEARGRRAEISLEMTPAQIAEAQRQARAWMSVQH